jgi:membrane-bound lytic murein transglycosylase B
MKKGTKRALIFILLFLIGYLILSASVAIKKNELRLYLVSKGLPKYYVQSVLYEDKRLKLVFPPKGNGENYFTDRLFGPESVKKGRDFLQEHKVRLGEAQKNLGVQSEYIVSILRIETDLGKNIGNAPAINYLYTWVVRDHAEQEKRDFAKRQLYFLLKACWDKGLDIFAIKGSYMGAIGFCQFLPENWLDEKLVIDGNHDEIIDLFNWDDAIMSIANYLKQFDFEYTYRKIMDALWQYNKGPYRYAVMLYAHLITLPE